jgi:hypothetical protein
LEELDVATPCEPSSVAMPGIPRIGEAGKHPAGANVPHAADEIGRVGRVAEIDVGFRLDTMEGQFVAVAETEKTLARFITPPRTGSDIPRVPQNSAALPGHWKAQRVDVTPKQ